MFRARTLLVVGAGASVEVGLPMGPGLLKNIAAMTAMKFDHYRQVDGDHLIFEALKIHLDAAGRRDELNAHTRAGSRLAESATQALSIDNVIDALENREVELLGKLGIVRAIWAAEASSRFFRLPNGAYHGLNLANFSETWYSSLTKIMTENIRRSDIENIFDNLKIINFNYDRCLEHYVPISLASYYGLELNEVHRLMERLVIYRPYGAAGRLPWQMGDGPSAEFGEGSAHRLSDVSQQIRTFTERVEEGAQLAAMKEAVAAADRIIFLGFAFHRQNVGLLATKMQDHAEILATCYQISASDQDVISNELKNAFSHKLVLNDTRVKLVNATCAQLFQDYWRTLTAEKGDHRPYVPPFNDLPALQTPDFKGMFGNRE